MLYIVFDASQIPDSLKIISQHLQVLYWYNYASKSEYDVSGISFSQRLTAY